MFDFGLSSRTCRTVALVAVVAGALSLLGQVAPQSRPVSSGRTVARSTDGWASLPVAARLMVSRTLGEDLSQFAVRATADETFAARAAGLTANFTAGQVMVHGPTGSGLALGLTAIGRVGLIRSLPAANPDKSGYNRVSYQHGGIREWYATGPLGLEQGVTLVDRPAGAGALLLVVGKLSSHNRGRIAHNGEQLTVTGRLGHGSLTYGDVSVTDAAGRSLDAHIVLSGQRILLRIDDAGARYPLRVDPLAQLAELTASDGGYEWSLGNAIAMSADGSTVAVGAYGAFPVQGAETGRVYVFRKPPSGWGSATQTAELQDSGQGPISAGLGLGLSVAISGDGSTIVASGFAPPGVADVFVEPQGGWTNETQTAELTSTDPAQGQSIYWGMAISGDGRTIAAASPTSVVNGTQQGAVFIFSEPAGGWANETQTATLTASDGHYGSSLGGGSTTYSDAVVGMSSDGSVVAAPEYVGGGDWVICVFTEPSGGWTDETETARLDASPSSSNIDLGASLALSGDGSTIVAGAPFITVNGNSGEGAVFVFTEPITGWANETQAATLTDFLGAQYEEFGTAVAVSGDGSTIAAGSPGSESPGEVLVFSSLPTGGYGLLETLTAPGSATSEAMLGSSVAVSSDGSSIAVGAPGTESDNVSNTGAAFVFGSLTVGPPTASIGSPANNQTFNLNQSVPTSFSCADTTGGPGIQSCTDSNGSTSPGTLDTSSVGANSYVVTATSLDGQSATAILNYTVDQPPSITSGTSTSVGMRSPFDFTVTTAGYPTAALAETGSLPAGVTFTDNGDGTADLAGPAAAGSAGSYPIRIIASNGFGSPASQSFVLTVTSAPSAPAITSDASDTETFGVAFSFTVDTTGYPAPKLTKSGALPSGVAFVDNGDGTATIAGTPANSALGVYTLTITAKNSAGTTTQAFTLTVTKAPVIKTIPTTSDHVGSTLRLTIIANGYTTPVLTESGPLPSGLTFTDNGVGTATIAGVPAVGSAGAYVITVTATNALGTATQSFTLKIDEAPTITSAATATASTGAPFSFQVTATGYPAPKITKTGALPKGVSFTAATGTFSGTPRARTTGSYPITITATNRTAAVTQQFDLTVR